MFSAGIRLYFDYNNALRQINQDFTEIETANLPSIAASLWVMDKEQLQTEVNGLLNVAHIKYAKIQFKNQTIVSAGLPGDKNTLNREFPIYHFHDNRKLFLGALYVGADLNGVYEELRGNLLQTFLYQGLEVFANISVRIPDLSDQRHKTSYNNSRLFQDTGPPGNPKNR